jgi:hypothetical protein
VVTEHVAEVFRTGTITAVTNEDGVTLVSEDNRISISDEEMEALLAWRTSP